MRAYYLTPNFALTATLVIVFLGEVIVMFVLGSFGSMPLHSAPVVDAALLTLVIALPLYFILFRPLLRGEARHSPTAGTVRQATRQAELPRAPRFIFLKTGVTVFLGEVVVMLVLGSISTELPLLPLIDAAFLTLLIFPALYFLLFRPVARATAQYHLTAGKLQQTTEQLAATALEWRVTFDSVESPILVLNVDGRVRRLNRAAMELAGKPYPALLGEPVASLGPGKLWQALADLVQELRETGVPITRHLDDQSDGRTWDIAVNLATDPEVEENRVTAVARDITDTTKLQESLRRTENMAAMGALVAGVAHEVRNPLFGILATLDALEIRFKTPSNGGRYLEVLRREANRLTELMQDLMDYGRPVDLHFTNGSVGAVINAAVREFEPMAQEANVELVSAVTEQRIQVPVDLHRLSQVFHNLIMNAIHFSPPQGVVEVEARDIRRDDGTWVQCAVKDAGPGIAAEDMPRIFHPFFTTRAGGTGLGLSIVQRIVEQHGGTIRAENRPEGGAALVLRLPSTPSNNGKPS